MVVTTKNEVVDKKKLLSKKERNELKYRCNKITESIKKKNKATSDLVIHINEVLVKKLWRENYDSSAHFIKEVLDVHEAYYYRYAKANRMYLYLYDLAKDEQERVVLGLMKEATYRELRSIATDVTNKVRNPNEDADKYKIRIQNQEDIDLQLIKELWSKIYPIIKRNKTDDNKLLGNSGFTISTRDIISASRKVKEVIDKLLDNKNLEPKIREQLIKQKNRIYRKLSDGYVWDRYIGKIKIKDGRLVLQSKGIEYDLASELSDVILSGESTIISIRRSNKADIPF